MNNGTKINLLDSDNSNSFQVQDLFDAVGLDRRLKQITQESDGRSVNQDQRQQLIALFRLALGTGQKRLQRRHLTRASGQYIVEGRTKLVDAILQRIFNLLHHNPVKQPFSLIATGGYGRGELAPFSDIDLLFLISDELSEDQEASVERMLYCLWDLGLDIGHAVRTIDECVQQARQDLEIRTSMLESRFLAGDQEMFDTYKKTLFNKVLDKNPEGFLRAKILEQSKRHEKFGNTHFYLEPNIKENPGGLRDIQTFFWISKYRYKISQVKDLIPQGIITPEEYRIFIRSREYLRRVRNALHYRANRREDRLTFQYQLEIAEEFGYKNRPGIRGVEQFMRRNYQVARQVGNLSMVFLRNYQEEHRRIHWWNRRRLEKNIMMVGGKVTVSNSEAFLNNPTLLLKIFAVAQDQIKPIHPESMRLIRKSLSLIDKEFREDPAHAELFVKMLRKKRAVAWVLRRMSASGVLGRYIPEFGRIIGQSQHDLFHIFTVDEHTLQAVEALRKIKRKESSKELPLATQIMDNIRDPLVLTLGILFHDIAKGQGGQHQDKGAIIAEKVCKRLQIPEAEVEKITWLVKKHLIFSRTAFRMDIGDPETVARFVAEIGTVENLKLLLILTITDIQAVGPGVWTPWKASLLRQLYNLTIEALEKGKFKPEGMVEQANLRKIEAIELLANDYSKEQLNTHFDRFSPDYFLHYDAKTLAEHFIALAPHADSPLAIIFRWEENSDTTELLLHTQDHPGLIATISGVLAAEGTNILSANITTTNDGMALDIYIFQNTEGKAIQNQRRLDRIEKKLISLLEGKIWIDNLMAKSTMAETKPEHFRIPVDIRIDNSFETFTLLEVTSLDRIGLLYTITRVLQTQGIQVLTAKISSYGEKAVDVFYIKDLFGLKLGERKLESITKNLKEAIEKLN
ncbi:MAG: [protein-PII] uridylyltransferase [Magnetococcales bacterium]|nr:[protein-PII] uridylyltransferase [Magnetococcales bacterium]